MVITRRKPLGDIDKEEDPFDRVNIASTRNGEAHRFAFQISQAAFSSISQEDDTEGTGIHGTDDEEEPSDDKIHPVLRKWVATRPHTDRVEMLISFEDDVTVPHFPDIVHDEPWNSVENGHILRRAQRLSEQLIEIRDEQYVGLIDDLAYLEIPVQESFWLINSLLVSAPLGMVQRLAERPDVLYLEPRYPEAEPPQSFAPTSVGPIMRPADVADGRSTIGSDPYFVLGYGTNKGSIALLDTGVRSTHILLDRPDTFTFLGDCVTGGSDCNSGTNLNTDDDYWNHGTASTAILSGNDQLGNSYRGVTELPISSYKVYRSANLFGHSNTCCGLDTRAVIRAFETAVKSLERIIIVQVQDQGDERSSISRAADAAFDAGAIVLAACGNDGPVPGSVRSPANAHKVIGVGCFGITDGLTLRGQSRGPTRDKRIKPDIQAPTDTETASTMSNTALKVFPETSGATPYAGGAAALLRNYLRGDASSIDPGQVYAALILSGQPGSSITDDRGAGPLRLPELADGTLFWGKVAARRNLTVDIALDINNAISSNLNGALWWPETYKWGKAGRHNTIDLHLIDPDGVIQDSSTHNESVFQRAQVVGRITSGEWILRIDVRIMRTNMIPVYWAAHVCHS